MGSGSILRAVITSCHNFDPVTTTCGRLKVNVHNRGKKGNHGWTWGETSMYWPPSDNTEQCRSQWLPFAGIQPKDHGPRTGVPGGRIRSPEQLEHCDFTNILEYSSLPPVLEHLMVVNPRHRFINVKMLTIWAAIRWLENGVRRGD